MVAIGIIGATVMPHNLYLHSALVQSRKFQQDDASIRRALQFNTIDTSLSLTLAFLVNAAILVLAAMVFFGKTSVHRRPAGRSYHIQPGQRLDPRRLPHPGATAGRRHRQHAVRGGAACQRAEQHHHRHAGRAGGDGRLHELAHPPWVRRLITRLVAVVPAILIIAWRGNSSVTDLLVLSQVVLALQLPFAMFPLLQFTSSRKRMGKWKLGCFLLIAGWGSALLITALDIYGLPDALKPAWQVICGTLKRSLRS